MIPERHSIPDTPTRPFPPPCRWCRAGLTPADLTQCEPLPTSRPHACHNMIFLLYTCTCILPYQAQHYTCTEPSLYDENIADHALVTSLCVTKVATCPIVLWVGPACIAQPPSQLAVCSPFGAPLQYQLSKGCFLNPFNRLRRLFPLPNLRWIPFLSLILVFRGPTMVLNVQSSEKIRSLSDPRCRPSFWSHSRSTCGTTFCTC